jgi:hypothetical protein
MRSPKFLLLLIALLLPARPTLSAHGSTNVAFPQLRQMTLRSGYIFAGTVLSVERSASREAVVDSVKITFRVDRGIRGVRTGQNFTIREWSGLWASGERYVPGQRVLLFLHKPSKLGFTSPVGGAQGRLSVSPDGKVILQPGGDAGFSTDPVPNRRKTRLTMRNFVRKLPRQGEE